MEATLRARRVRTLSLLVLGVCVVSVVIGLLLMQRSLPSDGTLWMDFTSPTVRIEVALRQESVLQGGDLLRAINGVPIEDWLDRVLAEGRGVDWQIGDTLAYQLANKQDIRLVSLQPISLDRLFVLRWGLYLAAVGSLVVGLSLLLRFPHKPAARALFLTVLGLFVPLFLHMHMGLLTAPRLFLLQNIAKLLGRSLMGSGFLHVLLVFPVPRPWISRRRYVVPLLYFAPPILVLLIALSFGETASTRLFLAWRTMLWFSISMVLLSGISLLHNYLTIPNSLVRGQLQWIIWGVLFGGVPYFLLTGLPEAIMGQALVNVGITAVFIMLVPLTIAMAIAKYRVFDVDMIISRTVLMLLFALFLTGIYRLLSTILTLSRPLGGRISELVVVFIATFLVGTAFWAYQDRLFTMVEKLLSRRHVDPQRLLNDIGEQLSQAIYLEDIKVLLTETVPAYVGASGGRLMILNRTSGQLVTVKKNGFSLPGGLQGFMKTWKQTGGRPLRRSLLPGWAPDEIRAFMVAQDVKLLFLLLSGDQVLGIWGLGPVPVHQLYKAAEVRILQALARQAAVAIEKASLVDRLEERGEFLEAEVHRRMHVLERERNRLNTILQNMVDGLLVTSPDGKIIMVNPVVEDLLHRSAQHLVAQPLEKFLDGEALQRAIGRSWGQPGRTEIVEFTLRGQNIRAVTTTLRDRSAVVTMLRDVTQDVEVDRMKSEFISSVSHELRTPLTSIVGFTKLIQRAFKHDLSPVLPDEAKVQETRTQIEQNLDIMLEESKRLADLVDDVLDVAALDTGEAEWHDQLYNFPALLQRVVDHMRPVASEKELQIRLRIDRGVLQLEADPDRIEQVLSNLLSNAIKFTSKGTVTVSASALDVGQRVHGWRAPEGGAIHVTVKDTGLGIPRAAQAELFQRFRQIDDSTGQKPRGSGLGLVICREIITHYGGIIWVESEMGKGSAFSFVLPVHHRTEPAPSGEGR